ncbi:MAG: 4Fe-4S binding protein [Methanomicrobia archaeon]|nr:4Fe-4S binding protein [Methanomicrobia archaeon]
MKRKIITINEELCTGCGLCVPNCPEGALQIIDGKARLVSDLICDGLGACIGDCPEGAISVEEREAQDYDERAVMENIVKQGQNVIKAHLEHLKAHHQREYLKTALDFLNERDIEVPPLDAGASYGGQEHAKTFDRCPGALVLDFRDEQEISKEGKLVSKGVSRLKQWPVQIMLVPISAPYFKDADLLFAADCVPFAYPDFHEEFLKGKIVLVGCPKLDDAAFYEEKITRILQENTIKSLTVAHMEVPCCSGLERLVSEALKRSGKKIPLNEVVIGVRGEIIARRTQEVEE